jgi:hypothetical protein
MPFLLFRSIREEGTSALVVKVSIGFCDVAGSYRRSGYAKARFWTNALALPERCKNGMAFEEGRRVSAKHGMK